MEPPRRGYYLTRDCVQQDADDSITFVGRTDHLIAMAGCRIGPFELESVLTAHPAGAEAAGVAEPFLLRGETIHSLQSGG